MKILIHLLQSRFADKELCPVDTGISFPLVGFCRPWMVFCNCLRTNSLVDRTGWKLFKKINHRNWVIFCYFDYLYLKQFIIWLLSSSDWRHSAGVKLGIAWFMRLFESLIRNQTDYKNNILINQIYNVLCEFCCIVADRATLILEYGC